jgi:hypothetical protein
MIRVNIGLEGYSLLGFISVDSGNFVTKSTSFFKFVRILESMVS